MDLVSFSIPTFRMNTVKARLDKLIKKAAKYDNPDIAYKFGEKSIRKMNTENGVKLVEFVEINVSGDSPRISGWQLLARVELLNLNENLIHHVPGVEASLDAQFRTHAGHCEHCNTNRRRNDVYVLTDGQKQIAVGRTCLRDFLGIDDPKLIVARAQFFEELRAIEEDDFGSLSSTGYYFLHEVLLLAAGLIRTKGYVSKKKQAETGYETTGQGVRFALNGVPGYEVESTEDDRIMAEKTIDFFRSKDSFESDYMENIRVLFKQDVVKSEHISLVSSAVLAAQRELAPKIIKEPSNFVGEVKQRLRAVELVFEKMLFLGHGQYGPNYLYQFKDVAGNVFVWFTGTNLDLTAGVSVKLDATVKEHREYNGVKQTVLTRAKLLD